MFNGLHDIDWSSMRHAYGSADEVPTLLLALRSEEADERAQALGEFYGSVHHQGDVYPCTTVSLPFLFELVDDPTAPGRAEIAGLLVSIGDSAVERAESGYPPEVMDYAGALAVLRERSEVFTGLAAEPDPEMRRAAIPGLGLFLDADRAVSVLHERLAAEPEAAERVLVVEAMGTLALRLPSVRDGALAWFAGLAADRAAGPETRLAAAAQRANCAPEQVSADAVPSVVGLLREMSDATALDGATWDSVLESVQKPPVTNAPPQIAAAFEHLDRVNRVHALTTGLLRTFHDALGGRVTQRTTLLAEQLRSPDPGMRTDALRMSLDLMGSWRGDYAALITLVAGQLGGTSHEVAAEAAAVLQNCHAIAGPAREPLAAYVAAQRAAHGPGAWAAERQPRRAYQEAVLALARLGDERAVPSVLAALDGGVDEWRAVQAAVSLPKSASQELVPRLCEYLRRVDLTQQHSHMSTGPALAALAAHGDQTAVPVIVETLTEAVRHERWQIARPALTALGALGPAAESALPLIRSLPETSDAHVPCAAVAALWSIGGDQEEVQPLLLDLLQDRIPFRIMEAADVLGKIGPSAKNALPRLRRLLAHSYDWVSIHCATALWDIGGAPEAPAVLDTLLQAWAKNEYTANNVVATLNRMGHLARPALPQLHAELARPRRSGRFASIENDEALQHLSHTIISRFD